MNRTRFSLGCFFQKRLTLLYISLGILFFLGGCAGVSRMVPTEQRIPLIFNEDQQGTFNQGRESLNYEYIADNNTITVQGKVHPNRYVDFLKVRLLFLDRQGNIIAGDYIYHSPYRSHKWRRNSFQDSVPLPDKTESISFDFYVEYRVRE